MLELSPKTNLLEENDYRYSLQDVPEPILYRDVYNYDEVPKVVKLIIDANRTGAPGDGKIFVLPVYETCCIRTGQRTSDDL